MAVLVAALYYLTYTFIQSKKDKTKIWVPPKAAPELPFNLGPPPVPVEAKDYKESTYLDHETELLSAEAFQILISAALTIVMSFYFNVHLSLIMQGIMLPLNSFDSPVIKKHLLGVSSKANGDRLYKELLEKPTDASLHASAEPSPFFQPGETRVEELPEEVTETKNDVSSSNNID